MCCIEEKLHGTLLLREVQRMRVIVRHPRMNVRTFLLTQTCSLWNKPLYMSYLMKDLAEM